MIDYLKRLGIALDEALNVLLLNGDPDQTISYHAAVAEQGGKRWGCWLCWALSKAIQPRHCALQLVPGIEPTSAAARAGAALLVVAGLIGFAVHAALEGFRHLL